MLQETAGAFVSDDLVAKSIASQERGQFVAIQTKYGPVEVNLERAVFFPQGLLGMPMNRDYCLTNFPKQNMEQFKLLQNLNDHELCFAVLPIDPSSKLFDSADIDEACNVTQIKREDLVILSIISVQRSMTEVKVTANMRAPLMVDAERRIGLQYVFPSNKYEIRHVLSQTKTAN